MPERDFILDAVLGGVSHAPSSCESHMASIQGSPTPAGD